MRRGRNILVRRELELRSKSTARTPAAISSDSAPTIREVGKLKVMVATHAPIPPVVWVERIFWETADTSEWFVGKANNVAIEIVAWIAQMPQESTAALAGSVPIWGRWFVSISEPPDRIEFLASAEPVRLFGNVNNGY